MKRYLLVFLIACSSLTVLAQDDRPSDSLSMRDDFFAFRMQIENEYTLFLDQAWIEYEINKLPDSQISPISTPPIKSQEAAMVQLQEIPIADSYSQVEQPSVYNKYLDYLTIDDYGKNINVDFYGAKLELYYKAGLFNIDNPISEKDVYKLYVKILQTNYTLLLADLAKYKEELQLNDGAFYLMTKCVVNQIPELKNDNQKVVFHSFILAESGYDVRIAKIDNYLALLIPTFENIYSYPYSIEIEGQKYHIFTDKEIDQNSTVYSYPSFYFINEKSNLSFQFSEELMLPSNPHYFSIKYKDIEIQGEININKIEFYKDYPQCDLSVYKNTKSDESTLEYISSLLKVQLNNYTTYDGINQLLSFVQYGFDYKRDDGQFGYEKSLFSDEMLFYPSSDCEDKSLLLSHLVERVFNINTLLLEYPDHIAVAVNIHHNGTGRYVTFANQIYTCCDPTYEGSLLGDCLEQVKNLSPSIIN